MRISILGPLEVDSEGGAVAVGGARVRALLAMLALEAGRPVGAERLIDALWPDEPPANAANALQTLVKRLRAALKPYASIDGRAGSYTLAIDPDAVDAHVFTRAVRAAVARADGWGEELERALALWRGPALSDLRAVPHLANVAATLEEERLTAVETRATAALAAPHAPRSASLDGAALAAELSAEVAAHPLRERLAALAVHALAAAGRQADALALYERTRATLADELGVDPGPDLRAAHLAVLKGDIPVRQAAPPRTAEAGYRTNLRPPLTGFVGRDGELAQLSALLGEARMVTIVGPGGAGKTRLATEAALRLDEAWMVELAPVTDPADVPGALLDALGLRDDRPGFTVTAEAPAARLSEALGDRDVLIVLDNCEHLIEAAALLAERLLTTCPGARVLATSREPLNVPGERLAPIPPLELPPVGTDEDRAAGYPSVRLLLDRAAAARPSFRLAADNVAAVVSLCRRLDGMPLAIELAAARLRTMTPTQLAERLDDRFRLLTGGSRTALPRQQTLRAVVEWSWDLLTEPERALARRLAVFAGGAALESVESVCDGDAEVLGALADKSLVQAGDDGRYRMLETIRAYALDRLAEAGEGGTYRRRLALHLVELAEDSVPRLRTGEQLEWIERLAAERDNLAATLRWLIDERDVETALRLCGALTWYWWMTGYRQEAAGWADQLFELAGETPPPGLVRAYLACRFASGTTQLGAVINDRPALLKLAMQMDELVETGLREGPLHPMLLIGRAVTAAMAGRDEHAEALLDAYRRSDDRWLASAAHMIGGMNRSEENLLTAVAGFREVGDRWGLSEALLGLAAWRSAQGEPVTELIAEVSALASPLMNADEMISTLTRVAELRAQAGDLDGAAADLAKARVGISADTSPYSLAHLRLGEAALAYQRGDLDAAIAGYIGIMGELPDLPPIPQLAASVRTAYGRALTARGDLDEAIEQHRMALDVLGDAPDLPVMKVIVAGFALVALARGAAERAAVLFGASGDASADAVTGTAAARTLLGDDRFAASSAKGAAMTRQELYDLIGSIR